MKVLLQFEIRVCPQFLHKPQLPSERDSRSEDSDASDIRQPSALHIAAVQPAHVLSFNAYPVLRPSLLLLTASASHKQTSPLTLDDIRAAKNALTSLSPLSRGKWQSGIGTDTHVDEGKLAGKSGYMLIYSCGRESGCSRMHKHMQLFPKPNYTLFPDLESAGAQEAAVPYLFALIRHPSFSTAASPPSHPDGACPARTSDVATEHIFSSYTSSIERFRKRLRKQLGASDKDVHVSHNVIMTTDWTLIIPRWKAQVEGIGTNAAGMMGMLWVATVDEMQEWIRHGPAKMLGKMGLDEKSELA